MQSKPHAQPDMIKGPITRTLLQLALPIMGAQLVQMLYNLTDMFWVGRMGPDELAATGAAGLYMWLSVALMLIGSAGAAIGVAQSLGAGNERRAKSFAQNALILSLGLGVLFGLALFLFRAEFVSLFGFQEAHVAGYTQRYLAIVSAVMPVTYISATLTSTFNASGRTRTPLICNLIGMVFNMVLDPLMIFTFGWGVEGAAIATALGQTIVCVLLVIMMKVHKNRPFQAFRFISKPDWSIMKQIAKWTVPMGLESGLFTFMVMLTSRREAFFGSDAMAISRVGSQIESLTWLVGAAFGSALTAFVGQNFGAKEFHRIRRTFTLSVRIMMGYGLGVSLLLAFAGRYLFEMFLPVPELADQGALYMRILAFAQIPMCLENVASNVFRGRGRTVPPSILNITCNVLRVPLCYLLSMTALGLSGVWIGISISACAKGVWAYWWYKLAEGKERREKAREVAESA